jgi:methionine synthase I (cobalamin-dependent)
MGRLDDILELMKKRVVLFDGAVGTMLMAEGLLGGEVPERWNLQKPETVKSIHGSYFTAGSDVVSTNTFGGNRLKLRKRNLDHETSLLNTRGAELARAVCPLQKFVAGDMGPSGELVAPIGSMAAEDLEEVFAEQAGALVAGGVDLIIIQTMFSLQEALAGLRGAKKVTHGPVFVSLTFERKDQAFFTMMGETPESCAKALEQEGADVVGANCSIGSREMVPLSKILRESTNLPVLVQPNAGKPRLEGGKTIYDQTPEEFAEDIRSMVSQGVNIVGGCCGTTPEFVSAVYRDLFES